MTDICVLCSLDLTPSRARRWLFHLYNQHWNMNKLKNYSFVSLSGRDWNQRIYYNQFILFFFSSSSLAQSLCRSWKTVRFFYLVVSFVCGSVCIGACVFACAKWMKRSVVGFRIVHYVCTISQASELCADGWLLFRNIFTIVADREEVVCCVLRVTERATKRPTER